MATRPTLPRRPVSLNWKRKREPPLLGGSWRRGGRPNTGCVLQTANRDQTSCTGKKKRVLLSEGRRPTTSVWLCVTFPPLCRTAAVWEIVMLLYRDDERVSSADIGYLYGLFYALSISRDVTELEGIWKEAVTTYWGIVPVLGWRDWWKQRKTSGQPVTLWSSAFYLL
jgi:hypothetical protein